MHRRMLVAAVVLALGATGSVTALAATQRSAPKRVTITTPSRTFFKINRYAADGVRWSKDVYTIRSGGTLVLKNSQKDEPHTLSVLKKSQVPRTRRQLEGCSAEPPALPKYGPCRSIVQAHAPGPDGNPKNPVVNKGRPGIDAPGDSVVLPPRGAPQPKIKVSAKKGTTIHFICLVHPWMQARLRVR